ncbi:MAG: AAA family ATPase [Actinomycetota bacterium]
MEQAGLPAGRVTFLMSDIEGSTRMWESAPDAMRQALGRHDELITGAIEASGGQVFKHTGDGFAAVFSTALEALEAAAAACAALNDEPWSPEATIRCRFGLHIGDAEPTGGDYFGPTITRSARVMDSGNGGQIIASAETVEAFGERMPDGMAGVDCGDHRLKDLGEPLRLFRIETHGALDTRPLRTMESKPHNLPVQLSSFVGREHEIKTIADLIREKRLVTLTGIGGVGKTRLALQVGAEMLPEFEQGVWFAELASLADPELIPDAVATAIAVGPDPSRTATERIVDHLRDRQALLVLDNCEHLIDSVADMVDTILRSCPDTQVLATSREGLAVVGEALFRVPSLSVDNDAAAVTLFTERAQLVRDDFTVNDSNRDIVVSLCERLDGIPLAIELATARLKMLTIEQIAEHLGDRFRLLTGGSRTAVERQRTLLAMMDWSHDLLNEEEQAILRRLSVFSGGFDYEAAERVAESDDLPGFVVLDLLGRLVEASLVIFDGMGAPRYRLLETVRQYSTDKLFDAGEADDVRRRHCQHFLDVIHQLETRLLAHGNEAMVEWFRDLGNYRAALTWAVGMEEGDLAIELSVAMRWFFWGEVMNRESANWVRAALRLVDREHPLYAKAVAFATTDFDNVDDRDDADEMAAIAEDILATTDDLSDRGMLSNCLANRRMYVNLDASDQLYRDAIANLREAGDPTWTSPLQNRMLNALLTGTSESGEQVLGLLDEAAALSGTRVHAAAVRATYALMYGEYDRVLEMADSSEPSDRWEEAMLILMSGLAKRAKGDAQGALDTLNHLIEEVGVGLGNLAGWHRATARLELGDVVGAVDSHVSLAEGWPLQEARDSGFWLMIASAIGRHEDTARLLGFWERVSAETAHGLCAWEIPQHNAAVEASRSALGEARFDELRSEGVVLAFEDLAIDAVRAAASAG